MIRFSEEKVLLLHQLMVAETGGSNELRVTSQINWDDGVGWGEVG